MLSRRGRQPLLFGGRGSFLLVRLGRHLVSSGELKQFLFCMEVQLFSLWREEGGQFLFSGGKVVLSLEVRKKFVSGGEGHILLLIEV